MMLNNKSYLYLCYMLFFKFMSKSRALKSIFEIKRDKYMLHLPEIFLFSSNILNGVFLNVGEKDALYY